MYKAVLPEHNDNISDKSPVREFFTLAGGLFIILAGIWLLLGLAVDYAVQWISPQREYAIFSLFQGEPSQQTSEAEQELQRLVEELKPCSGISIPLQVRLAENSEPNAMALPGGGIVVNSALLELAESENGLVFVLAHELGHFKNRDHLRGLGRGLVLVGLSSFLTGNQSSLTRLVTPALDLGMAQYSQEQESRADSTALDILTCYYGHAGGAAEFFQALGERKSLAGMHWFASHPQTKARIAALEKHIDAQSIPQKALRPLSQVLQTSHGASDKDKNGAAEK